MFRYIVKRVLLSLVTLWLLATIVFLMAWALPSDPARAILGHTASEKSVQAFRKQFGLNDGFLTQYWRLLKGLITFDFGLSWGTKRPVWSVLSPTLFRTAKEALAKATGQGLRNPVTLHNMEVGHDALGKPLLLFTGELQEYLRGLGVERHHLSISDEHEHALAFVILEGER